VSGDQRGITLIEILIVVTLLVVAAGVAMPWFLGVIEGYRLRVAAWEIAGDLRLARQKSVSTQVQYRICLSNCASAVPAGGYLLERQAGGWVLDVARNDLPDGVVVTTNGPGDKITFDTKGELAGTLGTTTTLTNGTGTYEVRVASTGRVRVCKGTCL
jgi:prepilin-type N-terminal cleavage/methylation domain-containing protein